MGNWWATIPQPSGYDPAAPPIAPQFRESVLRAGFAPAVISRDVNSVPSASRRTEERYFSAGRAQHRLGEVFRVSLLLLRGLAPFERFSFHAAAEIGALARSRIENPLLRTKPLFQLSYKDVKWQGYPDLNRD